MSQECSWSSCVQAGNPRGELLLKFLSGYQLIQKVNLRAKVGMLLDRMETNEVIQCLVDKGTLKRAWVSDDRRDALPPVEAMGLEDEGQVAYWSDQAFSI